MIEFWILGTYVVGTAFGYYIGRNQSQLESVGATIDSLIDKGFLQTRTGKNGEVEILKWNESKND